MSETDFLHFLRRHPVSRDVIDSLLRPNELVDSHGGILLAAAPDKRNGRYEFLIVASWDPRG